MTTLRFVDLDTARAAPGTRIVTSALVPSPWSEAAKGVFELARLPALVVGRGRDASELTKWTGVDNVPVVLHGEEPARTCWAAIVGLATRLAAPNAIVPDDPVARAADIGLIEMIAGEQGLGWSGRLAMIDASITSNGARGFPLPVAQYLAKRYGHTADPVRGALRDRVGKQLRVLHDRLAGRGYFGGSNPSALDVYSATFLTPLYPIDDATCPQLAAPLRAAFGAAHEAFGDLIPESLTAHRARMFESHLTWPIRLSAA
jgi:glutathione S-transferase